MQARLASRLLLLALLSDVVTLAAQPGVLESKDLYRLRSVGEVQISRDGERIAYVVDTRDQPGRPPSQVHVLDLASGKSIRLGDGKSSSSGPRWSPDGKKIAYFGNLGSESGLMVAGPDGAGAVFLAPVQGTNHPLPSSGEWLSWSPDGRQIAFVSASPGPETAEATGDPVVITRYLYKPTASEGMTRFNDNRRLHLFVVDLASKKVRQFTDGSYYEHSIDWSPTGGEILFVSNREPDERFFNYDIFAVKVADGSIRRLTATESVEYQPRWSPDGRTIAYRGTKRGLTSSETTMEDTHVWVMGADGTGRREIGAGIENRQGPPRWSPDGRAVYFTVQERGSNHLYRLSVGGGRPEPAVGEPGSVRAWSVGRGEVLAYGFHGPGDLTELYVRTASGARRLTDLNAELLRAKQVAEVEPFTFLSFDGREVEAFLTHPLGRRVGSKHPLITMIKGGPHGQQGPELNHKAQVYAGRGWGTLMVNYRGSTGYGQQFTDAIFRDQNGGEAKDVLYGVEAALRRYAWLDPERLGVEGGSYGGQLTNWLITQTNRFRAAIPQASISNLVSFNYMAYYHDYIAVEFGAFPHQEDLMDLLWERSPLKHVARVRTPTLIVHGENDNDVPIAEAEQFYIALKDVGVETAMVRYPREGHGLRETQHVVDLIDRSVAWYEKHFAAGGKTPLPTASVR